MRLIVLGGDFGYDGAMTSKLKNHSVKSCDERTPCRTPNAQGVTRIPSWKFTLVRDAILAVMAAHEEGVSFKDLRQLAQAEIAKDKLETLGSWGWHFN